MDKPGLWHPERSVELVAGTAPGGGLDRVARALAATFDEGGLVRTRVTVVNVPGDGARKAWRYLDERPSDPHVLSISSSNLTTDRLLGRAAFGALSYPPIACLLTEYIAFAVRSDSPIRDGHALLEHIARDPARLPVALSTSLGNPNHLAFARLFAHEGQDIRTATIRVFDSAVEAVADLVDGHVELAAVTAASLLPELERGRIRALMVSAPDRLQGLLAGTATCRDHGIDCVVGAWRGVAGTQGMTEEQVAAWADILEAAVREPPWAARLEQNSWSPLFLRGADWHRSIEREEAEMAGMLRRIGLLRELDRAIVTSEDPSGSGHRRDDRA